MFRPLSLIAVLLAACGSDAPGGVPAPAGGPPQGMPVEAALIKAAPLKREIIAVGGLRSAESVMLRPEIAGRVAKISFREGQPVAAGQVLVELDDSVQRAEVDQARAAHALAERNHARAVELYGKNLISQADRDTARANLDVTAANLALAEARAAKTRITAPFAASAGLRQVSPGDYVEPGQDLVNLEDLSSVKLDFRLSESTLPALAIGQKLRVQVDAWPGQDFTGSIYAIDPRAADQTRSIGVRARLPNAAGRLRPGLFARVMLEIANKPQALMVPEQAVFPQGDELFVYAIEDGKAVQKKVTVGQRLSGEAEIVSGLEDGATVITAGHQKIGPGAPVTPINLPAAETAAAPPAGP
jgi:membrane fusion protein, multidrug efflux system